MISFEEYFWSLVDKQSNLISESCPELGECWLFRRVNTNQAYGSISKNGKAYGAHQMAYVLTYGDIPKGLIVRHRCNVPACCNPQHLELGTRYDNHLDQVKVGNVNLAFEPNTEEKFWSRIDKSGPAPQHIPKLSNCWIWKGTVNYSGYGVISWHNKPVKAHRLAYELTKGKIPEGQIILHLCDNRLCCNPRHLQAGTFADNGRDMANKGRGVKSRPLQNGENCSLSKLTEKEVRFAFELREQGKSYNAIAKQLGVSRPAVSRAFQGKTWQHLGLKLSNLSLLQPIPPVTKLTENDVREIVRLSNSGLSASAIAERFNASRRHISDIVNGKRWKRLNLVD